MRRGCFEVLLGRGFPVARGCFGGPPSWEAAVVWFEASQLWRQVLFGLMVLGCCSRGASRRSWTGACGAGGTGAQGQVVQAEARNAAEEIGLGEKHIRCG
jgi:hypothetical protein